jgi:hypothetical protein
MILEIKAIHADSTELVTTLTQDAGVEWAQAPGIAASSCCSDWGTTVISATAISHPLDKMNVKGRGIK